MSSYCAAWKKYPDKTLPGRVQANIRERCSGGRHFSILPICSAIHSTLVKAAQIPHANPKLVWVPDDPRLLQFRQDFANGLYLLKKGSHSIFPKLTTLTK